MQNSSERRSREWQLGGMVHCVLVSQDCGNQCNMSLLKLGVHAAGPGFDITVGPTFSVSRLAFLRAYKGVYAIAGIR